MRFKKRKILLSIIILLLGFLIYQLLFGRLFIISPFKIGFKKHKTEYATVYYHKNDKQIRDNRLDSLILEVEQFHKLHFKEEVTIIFCKSNSEYKQYTGSSSSALVTLFDKGIFVSGKINEKRKTESVDLDVYLKHELSHLLLYQNMTFIKAINYPHWFLEGLAVYSSNQLGVDGYFTKKEIFYLIKENNFISPKDWGTLFTSKGESVKKCKVPKKYKFAYSEFAYIIDDMINQYGKEKFIDFLKKSLQSDDFYILFKGIYKKNFPQYLTDFKERIKANNKKYSTFDR